MQFSFLTFLPFSFIIFLQFSFCRVLFLIYNNLLWGAALHAIQVISGNSDIMWANIRSREDIGKEFQLFYPSCLQRMFEISAVLDRLESELNYKPKASMVAERWKKHVAESGMSEPVSDAYIEQVEMIRRRILSDRRCLDLLFQADDDFAHQSPWKSVFTIGIMAKKVGAHGSTDAIAWIIEAVNYGMKHNNLDHGCMSMRNFAGAIKTGNKGYCDLILSKLHLKQHLLTQELPKLGLVSSDSQPGFVDLASHLESHAAYEQAASGSQTWIGMMTEPAQLFWQFMKDVVYGSNHDHQLKRYVHAGLPAAEMLNESPLKETWTEVTKAAEHLLAMHNKKTEKDDSTGGQETERPPSIDVVHKVALGYWEAEA